MVLISDYMVLFPDYGTPGAHCGSPGGERGAAASVPGGKGGRPPGERGPDWKAVHPPREQKSWMLGVILKPFWVCGGVLEVSLGRPGALLGAFLIFPGKMLISLRASADFKLLA